MKKAAEQLLFFLTFVPAGRQVCYFLCQDKKKYKPAVCEHQGSLTKAMIDQKDNDYYMCTVLDSISSTMPAIHSPGLGEM
jgi:hypothetical protein